MFTLDQKLHTTDTAEDPCVLSYQSPLSLRKYDPEFRNYHYHECIICYYILRNSKAVYNMHLPVFKCHVTIKQYALFCDFFPLRLHSLFILIYVAVAHLL